MNTRIVDVFKSVRRKNNIDVKKIIKDMLNFSEDAWSKIKKNVKIE